MSHLPRIGLFWLVIASTALASIARADDAPRSSRAPRPDYPHKSITRREHGVGGRSYWLFEPAEPTPRRAPVVVFHHGWLAWNPGVYGAWIDHLVRSGRVVIFPRYQVDWATRPADFLPNTVAAVRDAFDTLETASGHVRPDRDRFALIGHSAGGNLAALLAATRDAGLPSPRALVVLMPGEVLAVREPVLEHIPEETLLVVVAAEDDLVVGDHRARQIFAEATTIPPARKKYVLYRTDRHGRPRLVADHLAPTASFQALDTGGGPFADYQMNRGETNTLDHSGFWRLADITLEAGFSGATLDAATGHGELFRHLGYWSDGHAVARPIVGDDLSAIPRVFPNNGLRLITWTPRKITPLVAPPPR